jgi:hypothetical protein
MAKLLERRLEADIYHSGAAERNRAILAREFAVNGE